MNTQQPQVVELLMT